MKMKEIGPRGGTRPWSPPPFGSANDKVHCKLSSYFFDAVFLVPSFMFVGELFQSPIVHILRELISKTKFGREIHLQEFQRENTYENICKF